MTTESLTKMKCAACEGLEDALDTDTIARYAEMVPQWIINNEGSIERTFTHKNFRDAFAFATKVALLAEDQGHHPDITVGWGKCKVILATHSIGGLSVNDFIVAAHIDQFD